MLRRTCSLCIAAMFVMTLFVGCGGGSKYPTHDEMRGWSFDEWLAFETGEDGFVALDKPIDELSDRELSDLRALYEQETGEDEKVYQFEINTISLPLNRSGVLEDYEDVYVGSRYLDETNRLELLTCGENWEFRTAVARVLGGRWKVDYAVTDITMQELRDLKEKIVQDMPRIREKYGVEIYGIALGYGVVEIGVDDPDKIDPKDFDHHYRFVKSTFMTLA